MEEIAELMKISGKTAPKSGGIDSLTFEIVKGEELEKLGNEMIEAGHEDVLEKNGKDLLESDAVLLIGINKHEGLGLDCGGCGFESCQEFNEAEKVDEGFQGPNCIFKILDLGVALGSAAKTASIHNVDSRMMVSVGIVAKELNLIDATVVIGLPISAQQKSPYFD